MISNALGTANTPRAHMNNRAAMDCLRDIGLWEECAKVGHGGKYIMHYRWCETLAGEEYARNYSWGFGDRAGDYVNASPCHHLDLPQSVLEPILLRYATTNGFKARFDTEFLSFKEDKASGKTICLVQDKVTGVQYQIATKYLFGADGGRSKIVKQLGFPMTVVPGGGIAYNVLVNVELGHLMENRQGNLHWCMRLYKDYPFLVVARMVKPWHQWMFVVLPKGPQVPEQTFTYEEWAEIVKDCIGDGDDVDVEVVDVSKWIINETSADVVSKGNIFCLGDAIHRHPPTLGLGSNTCIQDSFNLSWKISLVLKGIASPSILDTYNVERQPIAAELVRLSNDKLRAHIGVWQAIGIQPPGAPLEQRIATLQTLRSSTPDGKAARALLKERVRELYSETAALGIEMGQFYNSTVVYANDEPQPFAKTGREADDPQQFYEPCTYPGRRLPHVWLNTPVPGKLVSTIDIAGKGRFCLITGMGGEAWKVAAKQVQEELGVPIHAVAIGRALDWEDTYLSWDDRKGVEEDGAVLVRPDLFVAWRAQTSGDEEAKLGKVMKSLLGLKA
ncbi:FAD binding domain-containing protein [Lophiotrema nucula]|uniref:FAD binding domain-containing protein n=1 Tax=Lophiotrema nucula TaxID=690887 RepID=A0A6A5ZP77_9PLEO|nr:FAD binding domain-containing protein [Lophiotrema nucula]